MMANLLQQEEFAMIWRPILLYHAKCREQNQGAFYYMTDYHLDMFFGAYKRLAMLANDKASLNII